MKEKAKTMPARSLELFISRCLEFHSLFILWENLLREVKGPRLDGTNRGTC